jgi:cbb3-type cytochrome oxidase subunit 3
MTMEIGILRGLITLVLLAGFIALCVRVYGRGQAAEFEAAAQLPLIEDEGSVAGQPANGGEDR